MSAQGTNDEQLKLSIAVVSGDLAALKRIGNLDMPADSSGRTALMYCILYGHQACVEWLLSAGANANMIANDGMTALHFAAQEGRTAAVRLLIAHGATLDPLQIHGNSPLSYAIRKGKQECAEALIDQGADLKKVKAKVSIPQWARDRAAKAEATLSLKKETTEKALPSKLAASSVLCPDCKQSVESYSTLYGKHMASCPAQVGKNASSNVPKDSATSSADKSKFPLL